VAQDALQQYPYGNSERQRVKHRPDGIEILTISNIMDMTQYRDKANRNIT